MRQALFPLLMLAVTSCSTAASRPPRGPEPKIYGFPRATWPMPEDCDRPHSCGFTCGPCTECADEGPEIPKRQRGYGLIDLEVRDAKTMKPVPFAGLTIVLSRPVASNAAGVRPGRGAQGKRRALVTDAHGRLRIVLPTGAWTGEVGQRDFYPLAPVDFEVTPCLGSVVLAAVPLSRADVDPRVLAQGVSCDTRALRCRQAAANCPHGFARAIRGDCFDECVPMDACLCREDAACPGKKCDLFSGRCRL